MQLPSKPLRGRIDKSVIYFKEKSNGLFEYLFITVILKQSPFSKTNSAAERQINILIITFSCNSETGSKTNSYLNIINQYKSKFIQ